MATKSTAAEGARPASEPGTLVLLCVAAWAIPGAGHFWLGRVQKGVVFLVALTTMFGLGLLLQGRLFPFDIAEPQRAAGDPGKTEPGIGERGKRDQRLAKVERKQPPLQQQPQ